MPGDNADEHFVLKSTLDEIGHNEFTAYPDDGTIFKVFADERFQYLYIPSEFVYITEGSKRYLDTSSRLNQNPVLCRTLHRGLVCPRGPQCGFIHTDIERAQNHHLFRRVDIHKNDADEAGFLRYDTLPTGFIFQIPMHGNEAILQLLPSHTLYRTKGSLNLYRLTAESTQGTSVRRYTRCNFFENKKLCHKGYDCGHLHVAYED
ncbi:hypothetical protein XU18_3565 [Perkinsela sp. CCAP 1560/4]|nr:hypothetical protein XU18_3565 [Perkinsela sp. CCAP 1560/4]|eukprot:KNH05394.1 hypothetical protein XU18_3565 [Perkinsela sp. CCAP 1560/4]